MASPQLPPSTPEPHSSAWLAQVWISFAASTFCTAVGIFYLPVDVWIKGYLSMGLLFSVGSTLSLAKTSRDQHEARKITSRVDEARMERLLTEANLK
jgi:hypothetical protein